MRPSGLSARLFSASALAVDHPDRRRALEQRGEQVAARLRGVGERDALARQQQRAVEVVRRQRLGAEALRRGLGRLIAGLVALVQRDDAGDHGRDHQRWRRPRARAAAGAGRGRSRCRLRSRNARSVASSSASCVGRPVERGGQPRAAVEAAGVARVAVPGARGLAERAMQAAALRVLVEPAAQPRPLAQERLVRDLDRAVADRQQPALREPWRRPRRPGRRARSAGARSRRSRPRRSGAATACAPRPAGRARARRTRPRPAARPRPGRRRCARRPRAAAAARRAPLQSSSSAVESSGSAPGWPSTSASSAWTSSGSTLSPARCAGRSIARRSSSRDIAPTSTWLAPSARESSG